MGWGEARATGGDRRRAVSRAPPYQRVSSTVLLGPPPAEEGLHELVQIAVQDAVHVSRLVVGALVLDLLVGRQHIAPDEGARPGHPAQGPRDGRKLGPPLLPLA